MDDDAPSVTLPPAPAPEATGGHLLVGPSNSAGQATAWARAVRTHLPGWSTHALGVHTRGAGLVFDADTVLDTITWRDPGVRRRLAEDVVGPATHVLVETLRAVVGTAAPRATAADHAETPAYRAADVRALVASGRAAAVVLHGSEIRSPAHHAEIEPWSPFRSPAHRDYTARLQARADATVAGLELLRDLGVPVFVTTPDLLDHLPTATWLPVCLPGPVEPAAPPFRTGPPAVVHLPSNPVLKGSREVVDVLERLGGDGVVRPVLPETVAPGEVDALLRSVDVVVDQVVLGNPGVLAVQAMAAGRLVVAHLTDSVRRRFPEPPPVVEATPDTLADVLVDVAAEPDRYAAVAGRGPSFVARHHDGTASAEVLGTTFLRGGGGTDDA